MSKFSTRVFLVILIGKKQRFSQLKGYVNF